MNVLKIRKNFGSELTDIFTGGGVPGQDTVPLDQFADRLYQIESSAEREKRIRQYLAVLATKANRHFSGKLLGLFTQRTDERGLRPKWVDEEIKRVKGAHRLSKRQEKREGKKNKAFKVKSVTKWSKMEKYFGEKVITAILKNPEEEASTEEQFVRRLFALTVAEDRDQRLSEYLYTLEELGPTGKNRSFAIRQIRELRTFAEKNSAQIPRDFKARVAALGASIGTTSDRWGMVQREAVEREAGLYPEATCRVTELGEQDMEKIAHSIALMKIQASSDPLRMSSLMSDRIKATHVEDKGLVLSSAYKHTKMPLGDFIRDILCKTHLWFSLHEDGERHDPPIAYFWRNDELKVISDDDFSVENETEKDGRCPIQQNGLSISKIVVMAGDARHEVIHVHFTTWRDHHPAPDDETLLDCAKMARTIIDAGGTVGINCHLGIGRTGELSAAIAILGYIDEQRRKGVSLDEMTINIPEILYDLRRYRGASDEPNRIAQLYRIAAAYVNEVRQPSLVL